MILKNNTDINNFWQDMPQTACETLGTLCEGKMRVNGLGLVEAVQVDGESRFRLDDIRWENETPVELVENEGYDPDEEWPYVFANRPWPTDK